jgi:hypothetical protein
MNKSSSLRRLAQFVLASALAAGSALAFSTPAAASISWVRISAYHSGLVANVPSPWTANNLQVEQQPYGAMAYNGQWSLTLVSGASTYTIQNRYSNQCLDVENGTSTVVGSPVVQMPCDGTTSQRWTRVQDPLLPIWRIHNAFTGNYLGVENGSTSAGAGFIQSSYLPNNTSRMFQIW